MGVSGAPPREGGIQITVAIYYYLDMTRQSICFDMTLLDDANSDTRCLMMRHTTRNPLPMRRCWSFIHSWNWKVPISQERESLKRGNRNREQKNDPGGKVGSSGASRFVGHLVGT